MKKLLLTFIASGMIFTSCQKNDEAEKTDDEQNGTPNGSVSVGIAKNFSAAASLDFKNENAVTDFFKGEHQVAIVRTPVGKDSEIGIGKLVVSRDGNMFGMKLVSAGGKTLSEAKVDLTVENDFNYENLRRPTAGSTLVGASERLNAQRTQIDSYMSDNGGITGQVFLEGVLEYQFMNDVEYFGKTPPPAIIALKGTWEGPHTQGQLCQPNPVSLTISADGTITLKGKTALDCVLREVVAKWDGQGDFVKPNARGVQGNTSGSLISIDGVAAAANSGLVLVVPKLKDPASIIEINHLGAGASGYILVEKPVKK